MNRIAITKLAATALAVASLGIAGTAQAADPATGVDAVDAKVTQPAPAGPAGPATPAPAPAEEEKEVDYTSPAYFQSKEAHERYKRYCNMKDAEPSHSDKKFCEDYRKHNGGTTTTTTSTGGPQGLVCKPGPGRHPLCPPYPGKPEPGKPEPGKPYPGKPQPVTPTQVTEPSKGSLPFTGLEIWQLGLAGLVLAGGGFGVRRLLAS